MDHKRVADVLSHLKQFKPSHPMKKGYIAQLLAQGLSTKEVVITVVSLVQANDPSLQVKEHNLLRTVKSLSKQLKHFREHIKNKWNSFVDFCNSDFVPPVSDFSSRSASLLPSVLPSPSASLLPSVLPSPFCSLHSSILPSPSDIFPSVLSSPSAKLPASVLPSSSLLPSVLPSPSDSLPSVLPTPSAAFLLSDLPSPLASPCSSYLSSSSGFSYPPISQSTESCFPSDWTSPPDFAFPCVSLSPASSFPILNNSGHVDNTHSFKKLPVSPLPTVSSIPIVKSPIDMDHSFTSQKPPVSPFPTVSSFIIMNNSINMDHSYTPQKPPVSPLPTVSSFPILNNSISMDHSYTPQEPPVSSLPPVSSFPILKNSTDVDHSYTSYKIDTPASNTCPSTKQTTCSQCKDRKLTICTLRNKLKNMADRHKSLKKKLKTPLNLQVRELKKKLQKKSNICQVWRLRFQQVNATAKSLAMLTFKVQESGRLYQESESRRCQIVKKLHIKMDECEKLKQDIGRMWNERDVLLTKIDDLKLKIFDFKSRLRNTEKESAKQIQSLIDGGLRSVFEDDDNDIIDVMSDDKMYSVALRKCLYYCIVNHVAVDRVGNLINFIIKALCNKSLSRVPQPSTLRQVAYELGILADLQVGHEMQASEYVTLGFDSTTFEGRHVSELHISCSPSKRTLTLSLSLVPGGRAEDYHSHISQALVDIASLYSGASGLSEIDAKELFWSKIRSTISDRAKVNHCLVERLKEELELDLVELKCNIHPLDGLARAAKKTLAGLDKEWKLGSTTDSQCEMLIHNMARLRYSKSKGDPPAFCSFLEERNLRKGVLARYVGNRMNVLFHMAATIFNLRPALLEFANESSKAISVQVARCLEKPLIQVQLQCLGLFSKVLTGPWMTQLYKNAKNRTNLDVVRDGLFMKCLDMLVNVQQDPDILLTTKTDLFGDPLDDNDSVLQDLQTKGEYPTHLCDCIRGLATAFLTTIKSQLSDYLDGPLATLTEQMLSSTASAPVNNMSSERALGMMDSLWHRAPNAGLGFIESKVRASMNSTLEWMNEIEPEVLSKYVKFAVRHAPKVRILRAQREMKTRKEVMKRRKDNSVKFEREKRSLEASVIDSLSTGDVLSLPCFLSLDAQVTEMLRKLLRGDVSSFSGVMLEHAWHESGKDVIYMEMLKCTDSSVDVDGVQRCEVILFYCKPGEHLSSSSDVFSLPMSQFLVDFVMGDIRVKEATFSD